MSVQSECSTLARLEIYAYEADRGNVLVPTITGEPQYDALGGGHAEIVAWILILVTSIIVILDDTQKEI